LHLGAGVNSAGFNLGYIGGGDFKDLRYLQLSNFPLAAFGSQQFPQVIQQAGAVLNNPAARIFD